MSIHKSVTIAALAAGLSVSVVLPGHAASPALPAPSATVTMTTPALSMLTAGNLAVEPVQPAADTPTIRANRQAFAMPVVRVVYNRQGRVKSVMLAGGIRVVGQTVSVDLSQMRVRVVSQRATVRVSETAARVPAFDVARLKVTRKAITGVLVIAPGTSAVLNARFNTYVFVDGLRFATFESRL